MLKIDERKKVKALLVNNEYFIADEALEELGYINIGDCEVVKGKAEIRKDVYKKDGEFYEYMGMDIFNKFIYSVSVRQLVEL